MRWNWNSIDIGSKGARSSYAYLVYELYNMQYYLQIASTAMQCMSCLQLNHKNTSNSKPQIIYALLDYDLCTTHKNVYVLT